MNTYRIYLRGADGSSDVVAATPAAAKYQHYLNLDVFNSFSDYLRSVDVIQKVNESEARAVDAVERFFRVKALRGVPEARLGQVVKVGDRYGMIVGANASMNFDVMIGNVRYNVHPGSIEFMPEDKQAYAYENRHDICVGDRFLWHFANGYGTSGSLGKKYMRTSACFRGDMILTVCQVYEGRNGYGPFVDYLLSESGELPDDGEGVITINGPDARRMGRVS